MCIFILDWMELVCLVYSLFVHIHFGLDRISLSICIQIRETDFGSFFLKKESDLATPNIDFVTPLSE